ncbi:MAG: ACP S-malonyltransferase [Candidatus Cloacimonetes bacterium]|jgi:[acyl-carrier-protein] S-malonyltransferase|nr:ACP S-malonyltransferase [Candidatus Cloacimonadota bacterium]
MNKTAFIFPGQGAQYIGMAMDFVNNNIELENVLKSFDKKNNTKLYKIMAQGPEDKLKETRFTQPAILFHSIAALKTVLNEINIVPDYVAGHSLGEFSALVANGVLTLEDAMYLVHKRGEFMIKANDGKPFAMAAIIGQAPNEIKNICEEASKVDIVIAANFNTPVQTVISGSKAGVEKACELAQERGAKRIVPLVVGGPFHSPLIQKAATWLSEEMNDLNFNETMIPVVSNVNAKPVTDIEEIKNNLARQVTSSVLWVDSIRFMIEDGVDTFIEFGPKKMLAGMLKKIDKNINVISIDTIETFELIKNELETL